MSSNPFVLNHRSAADYIIVGLGLAGACLAFQLLLRKKKVLVFDLPDQNHASAVAAGLVNPVSGKMLAKAWMADTLFTYFRSFFTNAESVLKRKLFSPAPLYIPFATVEEQNDWMIRTQEPGLKKYIERVYISSAFGKEVHDPLGGVLLQQAGYVHTTDFMESIRTMLKESGSYREEPFQLNELDWDGAGYQGISAGRIIFCRGVEELSAGVFSWLPIRPLKGETLTVRMSPVQCIYNRGVYVVPGNEPGTYLVGATYDRAGGEGVTDSAREELRGALNRLIRIPFQIVDQQWGLRPSTVDRRPLLGNHPVHKKLVIFNGLGTKGVILAPFFSGQLAGWLEGEGEITREVNITRFKSLYSKFD